MKHTMVLKNRTQQAHEISLSYTRPLFGEMVQIKTSKDVCAIMRRYLGEKNLDTKEYMWIMCFSRFNHVLSISKISTGSIFGTTVWIPELFQTALLMHASGFVMMHNHPSGNLNPSKADIDLTKKVKTFGELIELRLLDHLILTTESYLSMSDEGLI